MVSNAILWCMFVLDDIGVWNKWARIPHEKWFVIRKRVTQDTRLPLCKNSPCVWGQLVLNVYLNTNVNFQGIKIINIKHFEQVEPRGCVIIGRVMKDGWLVFAYICAICMFVYVCIFVLADIGVWNKWARIPHEKWFVIRKRVTQDTRLPLCKNSPCMYGQLVLNVYLNTNVNFQGNRINKYKTFWAARLRDYWTGYESYERVGA